MKQGKDLWDIRTASLGWESLYHELPVSGSEQRILPDKYQCHHLKKLPGLLMVKDNFLATDLLKSIQKLSFEQADSSSKCTTAKISWT